MRFSIHLLTMEQKLSEIEKNANFLNITYEDKCSEKCVKYMSCLLWWLENGSFLKKNRFVCKKNVFLFFIKDFWPSKFPFCLGKRLKTAKRASVRKKLKKNVPCNVANNSYGDIFSKEVYTNKIKNTHLDRGRIGGGTYCN